MTSTQVRLVTLLALIALMAVLPSGWLAALWPAAPPHPTPDLDRIGVEVVEVAFTTAPHTPIREATP